MLQLQDKTTFIICIIIKSYNNPKYQYEIYQFTNNYLKNDKKILSFFLTFWVQYIYNYCNLFIHV